MYITCIYIMHLVHILMYVYVDASLYNTDMKIYIYITLACILFL